MKETFATTKTDAHLQRDVLDELEWEPSVDAVSYTHLTLPTIQL